MILKTTANWTFFNNKKLWNRKISPNFGISHVPQNREITLTCSILDPKPHYKSSNPTFLSLSSLPIFILQSVRPHSPWFHELITLLTYPSVLEHSIQTSSSSVLMMIEFLKTENSITSNQSCFVLFGQVVVTS